MRCNAACCHWPAAPSMLPKSGGAIARPAPPPLTPLLIHNLEQYCSVIFFCKKGPNDGWIDKESKISVDIVKFFYSVKATNFCKISTVNLSYVVTVTSTMEISQNVLAFLEHMNFNN